MSHANRHEPPPAASYRSWSESGKFDVLVISSGMGALTTAALLAKQAQKRVLVLEQHYVAGGFTHTFHRPGFEWDVGLHYVGEIHRPDTDLAAIFAYLTDGEVRWIPMADVYDRIIIGDESYDFVAGAERFQAELIRRFPGETATIGRYVELLRDCTNAARRYFAEKALPSVVASVLGPLLRWKFLRYAGRTTLDVLRELTRNEQLLSVLTGQWGDFGLPPGQSSFGVHAIIAHHYMEGAAYPQGGASQIVAAIAPTIRAAGGQILINAGVREILIANGRAVGVKMADGREIRADLVISGAGARNTFLRLLPAENSVRRDFSERLQPLVGSCGHLNLYVGLQGTDRDLGLATTNLWVYPSANHDANLACFLADPEAPLPSVYISFQSAKDPTYAERFPGHAALQVICPANYDWFHPWEETRWKKRGEDYEAFKQRLADRLQETLLARVPQLRGKIVHAELSTPLSTRHFANYPRGEMYGLAHSPSRMQARFLRPKTPIPGLFLTGQDVTLCGIAGAMSAGVLTASAILRRNLFGAILRAKSS